MSSKGKFTLQAIHLPNYLRNIHIDLGAAKKTKPKEYKFMSAIFTSRVLKCAIVGIEIAVADFMTAKLLPSNSADDTIK